MRLPRPRIVPDSKSPLVLLGVGAVLLTLFVVRAVRRGKRRAVKPSRGAIVVGSWSTPRAQAARARTKSPPADLADTDRVPSSGAKSRRGSRSAA